MRKSQEKHKRPYPTARQIRRACNHELYRTIKRMNVWIPPAQVEEAQRFYFQKVMLHLQWIIENQSNRKLLSDWWEENVAPEIARLWGVNEAVLGDAFRDAFGG